MGGWTDLVIQIGRTKCVCFLVMECLMTFIRSYTYLGKLVTLKKRNDKPYRVYVDDYMLKQVFKTELAAVRAANRRIRENDFLMNLL